MFIKSSNRNINIDDYICCEICQMSWINAKLDLNKIHGNIFKEPTGEFDFFVICQDCCLNFDNTKRNKNIFIPNFNKNECVGCFGTEAQYYDDFLYYFR